MEIRIVQYEYHVLVQLQEKTGKYGVDGGSGGTAYSVQDEKKETPSLPCTVAWYRNDAKGEGREGNGGRWGGREQLMLYS